MTAHHTEIETTRSLVVFTNRFAGLVQSGFSLVRTLLLLEDVGEPYGSAAQEIRHEIEDGSTLSDAMERRPALFTPFYIGMVRAGEIGGVLELTLRRCANVVLKEYRLMGRWSGQERPLFLASPSEQTSPKNWSDLSEYQRTTIQLLFCETFGSLLSYGVPILRTLEVMRRLLPADQAILLDDIQTTIRNGEQMDLARLGMLPAFVTALAARGEELGTLDSTLLKAAEILEAELDARAAFFSL